MLWKNLCICFYYLILYCTVLYCAVLYCTVLTLFVIFTHSDVEDSYSGPKLDDDISAGFMKNMLQWFKDQKKLHKKYCYKVSTSVVNGVRITQGKSH